MIRTVLPAAAVAVETRGDLAGVPLFPEEAALVAGAVHRRRREFATGRACARGALAQLGYPSTPLLNGAHREPLWPAGVVGSLTHCGGYRAAAVARSGDVRSLGIDAEPDAALPDGVLRSIGLPPERERLAALPAGPVHWDRLLFSAKEAVYKAWFPLARRGLEFHQAEITIDPAGGGLTARLLVPGPVVGGRELTRLSGHWAAADGLLLTCMAVPA